MDKKNESSLDTHDLIFIRYKSSYYYHIHHHKNQQDSNILAKASRVSKSV